MIRFLHTADLHLGKPFGRYPEDLRGRLREARHASIARLAAAARAHGAADILVAGDTFDSQTPAPQTLRQALHAMAADPGLTWWLLPGNHDSLAAGDLWQRIAREAPANVRPLVTPAPVEIAPAAWLLPAPCTQRRPGRDLTAGMADTATPAGALRIGLAHGAVQSFSEDGNPAQIPPDRADTAGLAFLALGDWHGQLGIGPRTWYAGTPEADGFRHATATGALLVDLAGARPAATPLPTGVLPWATLALDLLPGDAPDARLAALLPPVAARRDTLLCVTATGRTGLAGEAVLCLARATVEHDFAFLEVDQTGLAIDHAPADLDAFGPPGTALRAAAAALRGEADDPDMPDEDRAAALTALSRLYAFAGDAA
jgi:Calcineurin-like phosphoesterase